MAWTVQRSWFDPSVELLPPGSAPWLVHPDLSIRVVGDPPTPAVEFMTTITADPGPTPLPMRIRAFRQVSLRVGSSPLPLPPTESWKKAVTIDLRPYLGPEAITLSIIVRNPTGPPALSVRFEDPSVAALPWRVRVQGSRGEGVPAVDTASRYGQGGPSGWALLILGGTWALLIWGSLRPKTREGVRPVADHRLAVGVVLAALTLGVLLADLHNARRYPISRGYDAWGHQAYVERLAAGKGLPDARDGWQMYQPPLYYVLASSLGNSAPGSSGRNPTPAQVVSCVAHASLGLLAFGFSRLLFPRRSRLVALVAALSAVALPAGLQLAPMVTNEPFAGSLIAASLLGFGWLSRLLPVRCWQGVIAGIVFAAAMLSKFTGALAFAACAAAWLLAAVRAPKARRRDHWARLFLFLAAVASLAGWYYMGNLRTFGDPFVGNWDLSSGFHYEQAPGYRDLASVFRFGPSLTSEGLQEATLRSIPEGFFSSMWADPHYFFLGEGTWPRAQRWLLWLGLVPTALGFAGLAVSWRRSGGAHGGPHLVVVLYFILMALGLWSFCLEIPFFSTAKAFFAWSVFPVLAAWSAESLARLWSRYRWLSTPWLLASSAWILMAAIVFALGGPGVAASS